MQHKRTCLLNITAEETTGEVVAIQTLKKISTEDVDILFWQGNWKGCRLPVRIMEVLVQHF